MRIFLKLEKLDDEKIIRDLMRGNASESTH